MRKVLLVLLLALSGCMTLANPVAPPSVTGNQNTAVIGNLWKWHTTEEIFRLADTHCQKYGKSARYSQSGTGKQYFDCI